MKSDPEIRLEWVPEAYKEAKQNEVILIPEIGVFRYNYLSGKEYWFAISEGIDVTSKVELTIDTYNKQPPSNFQLTRLEEVFKNIDLYKEILYKSLETTYKELSSEEIQKMYFLAAIEFKYDRDELWFTLEPNYNNSPMYDGFKRFTVRNKEIIWSNIK